MAWEIVQADCVEAMEAMEADSVDAIVTDPPYGLEFMGKEWDSIGTGRKGNPFDPKGPKFEKGGSIPLPATPAYTRKRMPRCVTCGGWQYNASKANECSCDNPKWVTDTWTYPRKMQEWHQAWATEALRVLKPGGHLLAFGGSRTFHRLACAVEDAGFEIRDSIMHIGGGGAAESPGLLAWIYGSGLASRSRIMASGEARR